MNEPAVFGHVVTALNERNYEPLVHVPEAHSDAYADVLDRCRRHGSRSAGGTPTCLASPTRTACSRLR